MGRPVPTPRHWEAIAAADLFTVEVWTGLGLVRHLVFSVIELSTRRAEIAGIFPVPNGLWMSQVAGNLIDEFGGFLNGKGYLIHDRDPLCTRDFRALEETPIQALDRPFSSSSS